jgi:hypothetical protein
MPAPRFCGVAPWPDCPPEPADKKAYTSDEVALLSARAYLKGRADEKAGVAMPTELPPVSA